MRNVLFYIAGLALLWNLCVPLSASVRSEAIPAKSAMEPQEYHQISSNSPNRDLRKIFLEELKTETEQEEEIFTAFLPAQLLTTAAPTSPLSTSGSHYHHPIACRVSSGPLYLRYCSLKIGPSYC